MTLETDFTWLEWPFLDQTHQELAIKLDAWCANNLNDISEEDVYKTCHDLVRKLGKDGWLSYTVISGDDNSYGGKYPELDSRSLCILRETLGRYHALADFAFAMQGLGSGAISLDGTEEQKKTYLPAVARGEKVAAFALSEPNAGSDVAALDCTATLQEDGETYVIEGEKTWISNGGLADFYCVFVKTDPAAGSRGITAFIVDADTTGLHIAETLKVMSPHPLATLRFENCRVSKKQILGELNQGFKLAMRTLDIFRTSVAAAALGFARRALSEAMQYTQQRKMFGQTLADFQITQAAFGEMATQIDQSALLIYRSAWVRDVKKRAPTLEAAMAKMAATESAQAVIDRALQMFGGRGVLCGNVLERLYRDIRALRIYEGATEVQKLIISRLLK